ncbi:MAG TPA: hypothetical protein PKD00_01710 [Burkholderiales bacterium]|nr:hypothetical protein [Burkholderiales bacterium]
MYSVKDLHYGFRRRVNKIESLQNRNFYVEQIDDYLNEATLIFVSEVAEQFEYSQHYTDDLRQLIKYDVSTALINADIYTEATLPPDYYRILKSYSFAVTDKCTIPRRMQHYYTQSDDVEAFLADELYNPNFEWAETGIRLAGNNLLVYHDNKFSIQDVKLDYISRHPRIANPSDSIGGSYTLPNGTVAVQQDLILDSTNQPEKIMDIAALLAYMDISDPNFQTKLSKIINVYK